MKKYYFIFFFFLIILFVGKVQLQFGDWVIFFILIDIYGNDYRFYDYFSEGKFVVMIILVMWCVFCWNLYISGVMEEVYEIYGLDGSDEIMVFFIEGDFSIFYE